MKLFVWNGDDVLTGYTSGQIVAMALDLEGAHQIIETTDPIAKGNYPALPAETIELGENFALFPKAWVTWGGG